MIVGMIIKGIQQPMMLNRICMTTLLYAIIGYLIGLTLVLLIINSNLKKSIESHSSCIAELYEKKQDKSDNTKKEVELLNKKMRAIERLFPIKKLKTGYFYKMGVDEYPPKFFQTGETEDFYSPKLEALIEYLNIEYQEEKTKSQWVRKKK